MTAPSGCYACGDDPEDLAPALIHVHSPHTHLYCAACIAQHGDARPPRNEETDSARPDTLEKCWRCIEYMDVEVAGAMDDLKRAKERLRWFEEREPIISRLIEAASTYDSYLAKELADELKARVGSENAE